MYRKVPIKINLKDTGYECGLNSAGSQFKANEDDIPYDQLIKTTKWN
jgi:hypothetical protein